MGQVEILRRAFQDAGPLQGLDAGQILRALGSDGLQALMALTRTEVVRVLHARGLTGAPGSRLGPAYAFHERLLPSRASAQHEDEQDGAVHDLVQDLLSDRGRLVALARIAEAPRSNLAGYLHRVARSFIHDLQRRADPIGRAIYDALQRARRLAEEEGWCRADDGPRSSTRLELLPLPGAVPRRQDSASPEELRKVLELARATGELERKVRRLLGLGREDEAPRRTTLVDRKVSEELLKGLDALRRQGHLSLEVSSLVEAIRALVPAETEQLRNATEDEVRTLGIGDDAEWFGSIAAQGGSLERFFASARERVRGAPGIQGRTREKMLRVVASLERSALDGREPREALRALGLPKQTLHDLLRKLRPILQELAERVEGAGD